MAEQNFTTSPHAEPTRGYAARNRIYNTTDPVKTVLNVESVLLILDDYITEGPGVPEERGVGISLILGCAIDALSALAVSGDIGNPLEGGAA